MRDQLLDRCGPHRSLNVVSRASAEDCAGTATFLRTAGAAARDTMPAALSVSSVASSLRKVAQPLADNSLSDTGAAGLFLSGQPTKFKGKSEAISFE